METHFQIVADLENKLAKTKEVSEKIFEQMEYAIGHCKAALCLMRERAVREGFPDKQSEILFFKKIKPSVYSKLLYYQSVFELESKRLRLDKEGSRKWFQKELERIEDYMKQNQVKVQYYRCNFNHLDEKYFLRKTSEIPLELKDSHCLLDENFFTWHDHTFSTIMANEMLTEYIIKELEKMDHPGQQATRKETSYLKWTGHKVYLVELLYALHSSGMVNNGQAGIRELAEALENVFNVDLKDYYRSWQEIKQRKIEPAKFLDYLKSVLLKRIEDSDE